MEPRKNGSAPIAVVMPGGGARGAYEVGALSVLLPALERAGQRVTLWCGTSAGAINAALLGSLSHLPVEEQVDRAVARWEDIRRPDVLAHFIGPHLPETVLRLAGELVGVPGVRFKSLFDARPLQRNLHHWIDWDALHSNVRKGTASAVCVVATALADGTPVGFVEAAPQQGPRRRRSETLRYVRTRLAPEHVRASAAIPLVFPAVNVRKPHQARGWYIDGATRLNTPIRPALDMGAKKILVIGFDPLRDTRRAAATNGRPHLGEVVANVLDGLLLDQVNEDLRRLSAINLFFTESATDPLGPTTGRAARAYRGAKGKHEYQRIEYVHVTPAHRREIGELADEAFARRYGGLRGLRHPDYLVLGRLLGSGTSRGELLSFLLFDEYFIGSLIEAGRRDAEAWLARHPRIWHVDSHEDLELDPAHVAEHREAASLEEWRELHRSLR
jgi:NTE family protein